MSKSMTKKQKFLAASGQLSALLSAGYSASALRSAGYSASELEDFLADVPLVERPYSRLWADLKAKARVHKQSTWGPDTAIADDNVCGTPMCTAGHLVQMAGAAGYALRLKYGLSGAATLIHMKAHLDEPPQNFDSIPQDWALAYIEMMAAKEASQSR
jgi:hypothetical protein